ncbi:MAG: response regulator [Verrucomicrobia bacterium]|nr:response regulator [Verrucomicrobiota bacterium]
MNLLIVDDRAVDRKLLRAVFEPEGYRVLEATDGREALAVLAQIPVEAVISDLLMPNLDGYRLCREIRQDERWRHLAILIYTATYTSPGDERLALELGADAYLRKPASKAALLGALRAALARTDRGRLQVAHTELEVLNEYSQRLVQKLQQKNGELEAKNRELEEKNRLTELTAKVGVALTRREALRDVLQTCADAVRQGLEATQVGVWTLHPGEQGLELQASTGTGPSTGGPAERIEVGQGLVGGVAQTRRPYRADDAGSGAESRGPETAGAGDGGTGAGMLAGYPLIAGERLVGVLALRAPDEVPPAAHGTLMALADSLALGIQNRWAEQSLRDSEERFRQLADNINEAFWMSNPATKQVLYVSPAYEAIWGRTQASLYEDPQSWLEAVHPEDYDRVRRTALGSQAEGRYDQEYRIVRPDGTVRWVHDQAFPVRDAAGQLIRIAGVAEDVTEQRNLELQLRQAQKMEAIGRLAGGVAHDFNNLLLVILGHSEMLALNAPPEDPHRGSLTEISRAAEQAASLTRQLLAFSRQQVVEPTPLDFNALVAELQQMLRRLIGEDVQLQTVMQPGLSWVRADPGQLGQVIMNLAVNARDAMPQGGRLTIETREVELDAAYAKAYPGLSPGRSALLVVTDTGCGMTPDVQAHIFEPFFTTKPVGQGTGLGLSVVHGIVQQSGGHIEVWSLPGVGTTFKIYLPALEDASLQQPPSVPNPPLRRGRETILLVEDEGPVRATAALLLRSLGYEVLEASGAPEALRLAETAPGPIDLLMADVVMPGRSGRELADRLRQRLPGLKVLFQSGYTGEMVDRYGALAEGGFLQKPFRLETLAEKVREILDASNP